MSGDIGVIINGTNALKIIDRKKNIFKLSQGEYVAPEKLENSLKLCGVVADIFVYGDSLKSNLVAIVQADEGVLMKWAEEFYEGEDDEFFFENICKRSETVEFIRRQIDAQSKIAKFKGFERVKDFYVEAKSFEALGLLTTTMKIKRNDAKEFYQKEIDDLYNISHIHWRNAGSSAANLKEERRLASLTPAWTILFSAIGLAVAI